MQNNFFFWLAMALFNAFFFGAAVARFADGGAPDWFGIIGSFVIAITSSGLLTKFRAAPQPQEQK